ncbi:MAG: hypothetical protein RLZZ623_225 [Actinomycetota bacterium]|jgi:transcriptional regulator with XRE-family HTH domain
MTTSSDAVLDGLARELESARAANGRSLRDVAEQAGISAAYLQKLERAQVSEPSPKIILRLADALGLDYGRLMQLAGYQPADPTSPKPANPLNARLATAELTGAEERAVAAFIDHVLAQRTAQTRRPRA